MTQHLIFEVRNDECHTTVNHLDRVGGVTDGVFIGAEYEDGDYTSIFLDGAEMDDLAAKWIAYREHAKATAQVAS